MSKSEFKINNIKVNIEYLTDLTENSRKIDAIKYIVETTKISLKEAKQFVDDYEMGAFKSINQISIEYQERVSINDLGDRIEVTYFDEKGNSTIVQPNELLWEKVKLLISHHPKIMDFENRFYAKFFEEQANNTKNKQEISKNKIILVIVVVFFILCVIYFFYNQLILNHEI